MYDKTVRRRRAVLGLLVVSSLILLTAYFGEPAGGALHSVQRGVLQVVSPIQEGASRALKPVRDLFGWVGDTVSAKGELKSARRDRDQWRASAIRNEAAARDNRQLRGLLGLDQAPQSLKAFDPVTARVTGPRRRSGTCASSSTGAPRPACASTSPSSPSDGSGDEGNGLIGKVETVASNSSTVRLITDASIAVAARTVTGNATGVVTPKVGNPRDLILKLHSPRTTTIARGDVVVTAGTMSQAG